MEKQKYITLEVEKLEDIIINSINKVYGSHIGYITTKLKDALIENSITKEENSFPIPQYIQEDATQFLEHDARTQFLNKNAIGIDVINKREPIPSK